MTLLRLDGQHNSVSGVVFGQSKQARRLGRVLLCAPTQVHVDSQRECTAYTGNTLVNDLKQQHQLEAMAMA